MLGEKCERDRNEQEPVDVESGRVTMQFWDII